LGEKNPYGWALVQPQNPAKKISAEGASPLRTAKDQAIRNIHSSRGKTPSYGWALVQPQNPPKKIFTEGASPLRTTKNQVSRRNCLYN